MSACHWWNRDLEWWWRLPPPLRAEHIAVFLENNTREAYTAERIAAQSDAKAGAPPDATAAPAPWSMVDFHQGGGAL